MFPLLPNSVCNCAQLNLEEHVGFSIKLMSIDVIFAVVLVVSIVTVVVVLVAVVMNTVIAYALMGDAKHSLNSRAAFVHMAGDALSAVAVVIAGVVIHYTGWVYAGPLVSAGAHNLYVASEQNARVPKI